MADKKFSQFTSQAMTSNSKLVGIDGTANTIYDVTQLQTGILTGADVSLLTDVDLQTDVTGTLQPGNGGTGISNFSLANFANDQVDYSTDGTGSLPVSKGGTGSTNLSAGFLKGNGTNAISSVNFVDLSGSDVGNVLGISNGGTGSANTWKAVQQFVWTDGSPINYTSITNNVGVYLPFNTTAIIDVSTNTAGATKWTAVNSAQGVGNVSQQCTFTLGNNGGGTWKIDVMVPMFDLDDFTTARLALDIDGTEIAIFEHNWQAGRTQVGGPAQSLYGSLTSTFSGNENIKLLFYGNGSGGGFFPAGNSVSQPFFNNRPPEITFTRVI